MTNEEIKALIDEIKRSTQELRATNDKAIAEKASKGYVDSLLQEKLAKIEQAQEVALGKLGERFAELERRAQVAEAMGEMGKPEAIRKEVAEFAAVIAVEAKSAKIRENAASLCDAKFYSAYRSGLEKVLRQGEAAHLLPEEKAAMEVGSDPNGGYLVTPAIQGRIVKLQYETTPMRQLANVVTISADRLEGDNDLDEADASWVGEKETRSDTDTPETGEWEIVAHELYAQPKATQKLLDDAAIDLEAWLAEKVASKFSRKENTAFVAGTGVKQPRGFLDHTMSANAPSASSWQQIEITNSGASAAFAASNPGDKLIDLVSDLKSQYLANAKWLMARLTLAAARKLKDGQGNYLWQPDFSQGPRGTLLGFPVVTGEDMPALAANSLSLAFGDFKEAYTIVDRIGIRVLRDPFTDKPNVRLYTTKRVGGDMVNFEAIKVMKFAA